MRWGARGALVVGLALAAMAANGARSEVRQIHIDTCSESCGPSDDFADGEDAITLSLSSAAPDDASDASPALVLDPKTTPAVLASGLPSPIASASARNVSPYDFFEDVIDIPLPVDAQTGISATAFLLFAPSLLGRLTLTEVLSNSAAVFGRGAPRSRPAL